MSKPLRQVFLFGAPTLVGLLNLTHPAMSPPVYSGLIHHLSWWISLHVLNLGLFPLLGLSAYLLIRDVYNLASSLAKVALAIFVPMYAAFDALAGIGTGILVWNANHLSLNDLPAVEQMIDAFWNSSLLNAVAAVGSIAWVIAMLATAVAFTAAGRRRVMALLAVALFAVGGWAETNLFLPARGLKIPIAWWLITIGMGLAVFVIGKSRVPTTLLVLAGSLFGASHVPPTGPLGMLCFLGAALYLEFVKKQPDKMRPADLTTLANPIRSTP